MSAESINAQNRRAALWVIFSMAAFAVEDTFLKVAATSMPPGQVLIVIGVLGGAIFSLLATMKGERVLSTQALRGAPGLRNLAELVAALTYILAMALIPVALVSSLMQTTPLLVTAGAALFLGETVGWRRWCAIAVGLVGVLVILNPWEAGIDLAGLSMILCVVAIAVRDLVTRRMPANIGSMSLSAWGVLSNIPAGIILMLLMGDSLQMPTPMQALILTASTLFGLMGYYVIVYAMRIGEISAVAPFRYTRLLFNIVLALVFLGETLSLPVIIGSAIVVSSGLYMFSRMRRPAKSA